MFGVSLSNFEASSSKMFHHAASLGSADVRNSGHGPSRRPSMDSLQSKWTLALPFQMSRGSSPINT